MEEEDPGDFSRFSQPTEPETSQSSKFPMNESKVKQVCRLKWYLFIGHQV